MITLDITLLIQIINIIVLMVVMNAVLYKPVRTVLEKRGRKVDSLNNDIDAFTKNAGLRQEEIDRKLQEARNKAKAELETARNAAHTVESETLATIRSRASADKETQLAAIKKEFETAKTELMGQVDGFAAEMAGKILGRSL